MLERSELLLEIDGILCALEAEYRAMKGLILTEKDAQCLLYRRLAALPHLMEPLETEHPEARIPLLHAELRWFTESKRKDLIPDLTIVDPRNLRIGYQGDTGVRFPSDDHKFTGYSLVLYLKFAGHLSGIRKDEVARIEPDVNKMTELIRRYEQLGYSGAIFCYFVTFSKVAQTCSEFSSFVDSRKDEQRLRFVELFGDVPGRTDSR